MKITEKVAFNIASEASYVYTLSGQKFIKNAKNVQSGEFLKTWTVLPDRSFFKGQKFAESTKIEILKWDILGDFQTMCNTTFDPVDPIFEEYIL